jgi:hypothetical protein
LLNLIFVIDQNKIDSTNDEVVQLNSLTNEKEIIENFQMVQSVELGITEKKNDPSTFVSEENTFKDFIVYVINRLNNLKQLNQGFSFSILSILNF